MLIRRCLLPFVASGLAARRRRAGSPTKACGRSTISRATLVRERYGVEIDDAWLERVRRGTVRLAGCTASFVSPNGLILTNHHCVASCLAQNSTRESSLLDTGFVARTRESELDCPVQIADVLEKLENVTAKVQEATRGLDERGGQRAPPPDADGARGKPANKLHEAAGNPLKCEAVTLYGGGQYLALSISALRRRAARASRPRPTSRRSAATRTTSSFRAGASTSRCCALTRTAGRPRRRST